MSELLIWRRVPPGAELEVTLSPLDGEFTARGQVFRFSAANPPDEEWTDADLRPGPKQLRLARSTDYIVDILLTFVSEERSEAAARVAVIKPNGLSFGKPQTVPLKGKNGDPPDTVSVILITL